MVDPPIDDEAYGHEEPLLPTLGQRRNILALVGISTWLGRTFDAACPLVIAYIWIDNMIPASLYMIALLILVPLLESLASKLLPKIGRIAAVRVSLCGQRICTLITVALFEFSLRLRANHRDSYLGPIPSEYVAIACLILLLSLSKAARTVYLVTLDVDWVPFLAAEQVSAASRLSRALSAVARPSILGGSAICVVLFLSLSIRHVLVAFCVASLLLLPVELLLAQNIIGSCYALHLPRTGVQQMLRGRISYGTSGSFSEQDQGRTARGSQASNGATSSAPDEAVLGSSGNVWERALALKQRSQHASLMIHGVGFGKATILCAGPQVLLYILSKGHPIGLAALLPFLQIALNAVFDRWIGRHLPVVVAACASITAAALVYNNLVLAACAAILALQIALQAMERKAEILVNDLSGDVNVARTFYAQNSKHCPYLEAMASLTTIYWFLPDTFVYPAVCSTALTCIGLVMFETALLSAASTD